MIRSTSTTGARAPAPSLANVLAQAARSTTNRSHHERTPFLHWSSQEGAYVTGTVQRFWRTSAASVAELQLEAAHAVTFTVDGEPVTPESGALVNLGLGPVALSSNLTEGLKGARVVVGFERWAYSRVGKRYRRFVVRQLDRESGGVR